MIEKVSIQVDVVLVGAAPMREPVRVHRVDEHQRRAGIARAREKFRIAEQRKLCAGTAVAFDAVRA